LMTEPQLGMTYDQLLDLARLAESLGLAGFSRSDHYRYPEAEPTHATDAFATLSGLARDTKRIDLCVLVAPIMFRHPGVLAKMACTIDEMSNGRFVLGVGAGWLEEEHTGLGMEFPDVPGRMDRLEEALEYLHHAFGRRSGSFAGEHYAIEATEVLPKPTGRLPIIVGGGGERRTPRLAGTYADEYNMGIKPPQDMKLRIGRAHEAAERAGRDPADLLISVMTGAIVGATEASFQSNLERTAAADPFDRTADDLTKTYRERNLPFGTPDQVAEVMGGLADLGVGRMYLQTMGPYDHDLIEEATTVLKG